jgi:hypothetical protein
MNRVVPCVIAALALGLSACTNPYDPVQRRFAGGLRLPPDYGHQGYSGYPSCSGLPGYTSPCGLEQPNYVGSPTYEDPRDLGEAPLPPSSAYQNPPFSPVYSVPDYQSPAIS